MRRWIPYLVALMAVGAALGLRVVLDPWLGARTPYITVFGAVIVAAWYGGFGPGLVAAALGWIGSDLLFVEPRGRLAFRGAAQLIELFAYALSTFLIAALGGAMQRARQRSEASEQRFRAFMQNSPNGVFLKDEGGRYLFMNRTGERLASRTDWLGKTDEELIGGRVAREIRAHDHAVLEKNAPQLYDLAFPTPDGVRTLRSVKFPLRDAEGRRHIGSITTDVTEQVRSDAAVREAQQKLQTVADALPAAVTLCSRDLRYLWINRFGAQWLGRTPQEVIGKPMDEVIGAKQLARIRAHIERVLAGEHVSYEREVDYPGIGRRWASVRFAPAGNDSWVAVITDIHELKRMEQALREADRRKDQFIATLAHELRNPLAPIRSAVEILARADAAEHDRAWSRGVIERQVAHMSRLVDDLLDMARISSGKLSLRRERVTIAAVTAAALETSRPAIDAAGHRLVTRMSAADAVLDADPTRVAQVLSNLLNNAAKYTAPGGVIELHADQVGGEAVIAVLDNGMGFPPELAHQLFEPFAQWAPAEQSAAGLGIGLSLVRGILDLHGGTIRAESEGPGTGSRFEVRLPLAVAEPAARGAPAAEPVAPHGMRVMIADDNRDAADSLCRVLALYGYEARAAYDGASAIEMSESFRPHVAVLDIGMPVRNGYDVARHLRARRGRDLRLIALTGWGGDGDVQRARDAGFDAHVTKPVDPGTLNEMICRASA
ncbi:MAG TPA: PAS domain-containing protein [Burkholderiales bacterium]|nr:PAS domain-containing protein [Burkholderiales bacterium]